MERTKENIVGPYRLKLNPNAKTRYDEKKRESKDWILTSRATGQGTSNCCPTSSTHIFTTT